MIDGEVKLMNDPKNGVLANLANGLAALNNAIGRKSGTEVFDHNADQTVNVDSKIVSISVDASGKATATLADGSKQEISTSGQDQLTSITSNEGGDQYMVDSNTGAVYKGTPDKTSANNLNNKQAVSSNK